MGFEIERKFLVLDDGWKTVANQSASIRQGYLSLDKERNVRIRTKGEKGFLTIKGKTEGVSRLEYEYEIPLNEAISMLSICHQPLIEKTRYELLHEGFVWELDVFFGDNEGLVVAEIELEHEDVSFPKPDWLGKEVSYDPRYFNSYLAQHCYKEWKDEA